VAEDELPPGADDLYGLPLEQFTAERGALAKRLRADGDRAGAKRVGELRKPSVAAWTINQLVRSRGKDVAAFRQAAEGLRDAQAALLEGSGTPQGLRDARTAQRKAVEELLAGARGLFPGGREPGNATLERVASTLHAAAVDDAIREEVLSGRLITERQTAGFGGAEMPVAPAPRKRDGAAERRAAEEAAREAEEAAEREAAERKAEERRRRRAALEEALAGAVEERERAEEALETARAQEARLRKALDEDA
jgi:hypothetical protein